MADTVKLSHYAYEVDDAVGNAKNGVVKSINGQSGDVTLAIPTKTSDIANDSGFITRAAQDLLNYYLKSETYNRTEIDEKISAIPKFSVEVVNALPTSGISATTIYLVPGGSESDLYTEYINISGTWEVLGSQKVDLAGYAKEAWVIGKIAEYKPAFYMDLYLMSEGSGEYVTNYTHDAEAYADMVSAYESGRPVYARHFADVIDANPMISPLVSIATDGWMFALTDGTQVYITQVVESGAVQMIIPLVTPDQLPTQLPNPNALKFTGAVSGSYDGSGPVTINIPTIAGEPGVGIASIKQTSTSTADGGDNVITITLTNGQSGTFTVKNGSKGSPGSDASVTANSIKNALGYTPMNPGDYAVSVKALGAVGNGTTDDTAVIQNALATYRKVYMPGGAYKLSSELVIRDNCQLELAQDVVLNFTQTSGNCITLNRSSWLKGNHATIFVPYSFNGNALNAVTTEHTSARDVPPWTHYDPQWKTARYITDINICKFDDVGRHWSKTGDTAGTAVYISATGGITSTFMWGTNLHGLRIAGAFEYGIRAQNFSGGWCHEMRLEAFVECCKIGISLEDCNKVYISGSIQPKAAADGTPYAQHGVQIIRSIDTELTDSRVWDWNETNSLWTYDKTNVNQHIAMYGNCRGTILNDYNYYHIPSGFDDLRELIYTDTPANFDSLIIIQEPFTRWFKPVNGEPYFNNGDGDERLVFKKEQDALFQTDYMPDFTDVLASASDGAGAIFNEIGYKQGYAWGTNGTTLMTNNWSVCTGYIPCAAGDTLYFKGMNYKSNAGGEGRIIIFDSSYAKLTHVNRDNIVTNASYYHLNNYVETDDGFSIKIVSAGAAFIKLNVDANTTSGNPVISRNKEITYTQVGTLASGIKVNEQNLFGMEGYEKKGRMVTAISENSTDAQYPSAKAVYDLLSGALGAYVDEIDTLIGGD